MVASTILNYKHSCNIWQKLQIVPVFVLIVWFWFVHFSKLSDLQLNTCSISCLCCTGFFFFIIDLDRQVFVFLNQFIKTSIGMQAHGHCSLLTCMQHMHHLLPQDELKGSSELGEIRWTVHRLYCKVNMTGAKIKKTAPQQHLHT